MWYDLSLAAVAWASTIPCWLKPVVSFTHHEPIFFVIRAVVGGVAMADKDELLWHDQIIAK